MPAPAAARQSEAPGVGWFATALAQRLLRVEQHEAIPALTGCFGRHGLYLRCDATAPADLSGNLLQSVLHLHGAHGRLRGDLDCEESALPLQRESADLVYLLHVLESCADPHALMLEIERVLAPDGTLLLVVLNPYSLWRSRWAGSGARPWSFGACRALLRDTGLEVVRHCGLGPVLPWLREGAGLSLHAGQRDPWSVWRAGYLVRARKHRPALTPIRPMPATVAFGSGMRTG